MPTISEKKVGSAHPTKLSHNFAFGPEHPDRLPERLGGAVTVFVGVNGGDQGSEARGWTSTPPWKQQADAASSCRVVEGDSTGALIVA